jgi:hypothetical protein
MLMNSSKRISQNHVIEKVQQRMCTEVHSSVRKRKKTPRRPTKIPRVVDLVNQLDSEIILDEVGHNQNRRRIGLHDKPKPGKKVMRLRKQKTWILWENLTIDGDGVD